MAKRTFQEVLTDINIATQAKLIPKAVSQIVDSNIVTSRLHKKSKPVLKGKRTEIQLLYGKGTVIEKNSQFEKIIVQIFEQYDKAIVYGQLLEEAVGMGGLDVDVTNMGAEALMLLTEAKVKAITEDFQRKHAEMLFRTSSKDMSKFPSLYEICTIVANGTAIAGIKPSDTQFDGTNYAYNWKPHVTDYTAAAPTYANLVDPTSTYFIEKILRKKISLISETSGKKPTLGVMPQLIWDAYDEVLTNRQVTTLGQKRADNGFDIIKFRGVDFVAEPWCPGGALNPAATSTVLIINENYLDLGHSPNLNHKYYPWKEMEQQWVYRAMMRHFGTIYPTRRDVHGAITGLPSEHTS